MTDPVEIRMTSEQLQFLILLAGRRWLVGPDTDQYQGDLVHISGPELKPLLQAKMVGKRRLSSPRERDDTPYLQVTHRYKILKAGKAAITND
jgi:hypothetical protein